MSKGLISLISAVFILVCGAMLFVERVPEGETAVVYTPSGGASETLNPGWRLIGLFEKTQHYPTRVAIMSDKLTVTTSDGKKVTMPVKYEMKVDKSKVINIFKELGSQDIEQIQEGYLYQKLFKAAREVISSYSVIDIYGTKTATASAQVTEKFAKAVEKQGFIVTDVTLGTPELDEATQSAIDARVQTSQQLEQIKLQKELAQEQAEKKKIEAQGEADAKLIEAQAEADANKIVSESLTDRILKQQENEARLKHGWVTVQGANTVVTK